MDRLLTALFVLSLVLIIAVLTSVRRAHIRVEYSVSWLLAAVLLLALSMSQSTLVRVGELLGVRDPASALLTISGCIFVVVLYRLSLRISGLSDSNIALAQKIAILEYRQESLDEKNKTFPAG